MPETPADLVPVVYRSLSRRGCSSVFTTWHLALSGASGPGELENMDEALL